MSVGKYFAEFMNYFVVITIGCILFNIISNRFLQIYWQNAILVGFVWALVYTTIKIMIKNKYRAK
ncbi:MAG: hypothetical protein MUC94_13760 [bacterium]|nr:hypothetical protein [bacterium]